MVAKSGFILLIGEIRRNRNVFLGEGRAINGLEASCEFEPSQVLEFQTCHTNVTILVISPDDAKRYSHVWGAGYMFPIFPYIDIVVEMGISVSLISGIINPKQRNLQKKHTWSEKKTPSKKHNTQKGVLVDHLKKTMTIFCKIMVFVQAFLSFFGTPCGTCL